MPVSIPCPNASCGKVSLGPDDVVGKPVRCKHCGHRFVAKPTADGRSGDTVPPPSEPSPIVVRRIGRFEIRARLGAGAFGTVYRA